MLATSLDERMGDPYEMLGVGKDASKDEIDRAFRRKAARTHPDAGRDGTEHRALTTAY